VRCQLVQCDVPSGKMRKIGEVSTEPTLTHPPIPPIPPSSASYLPQPLHQTRTTAPHQRLPRQLHILHIHPIKPKRRLQRGISHRPLIKPPVPPPQNQHRILPMRTHSKFILQSTLSHNIVKKRRETTKLRITQRIIPKTQPHYPPPPRGLKEVIARTDNPTKGTVSLPPPQFNRSRQQDTSRRAPIPVQPSESTHISTI